MRGATTAPLTGRTGTGFRPGDRKRLRFTREGWYYTSFTVGVGLAALNTGNNLLFLVFGLLLTLILVSGILSEIALAQLALAREVPHQPCAGDPFLVTYRITNRKRFWPSLTLVIEERGGPLAGVRASLLQVDPGGVAQVSARAQLNHRGLVALEGVRILTRFPFGLFEKSQPVALATQLCVLPRRVPARERRAAGGYRDGERPENRPGEGSELHGLRDLRPGDDRRMVHWRKSASAGRLLAIEREREHRRRVVLVVDNRGSSEGAWLDRRAEAAAALARVLSSRGLAVGLSSSGLWLAPEAGPAALLRLLRELAILAPAPAGAPEPSPGREGVLRVDWES
jgi:uncharacterized protein (DUF58 family)